MKDEVCALDLRLMAGRTPCDIAYTILPFHLPTVRHLNLQTCEQVTLAR